MELARRSLHWAMAQGMREVVLCAGARNLALVATAVATPGLRCWNHPEERSAGFFALGRIRAGAGPVGVVVTSGTAVAELLPAAIEAYYQGLPLLLLTADRPTHYRGTAAPQAIEQPGLFGPHAVALGDIAAGGHFQPSAWDRHCPGHLNLCFDEPILDGPADAAGEGLTGETKSEAVGHVALPEPPAWDGFGQDGKLLVMVGNLSRDEREPVARFLSTLGAPVWLESTSNLWGDDRLLPIWCRDTRPAIPAGLSHVLRLGGVPCDRLWRDLEARPDIQVRSLSRQGWSGLGRPSEAFQADLAKLLPPQPAPGPDWLATGEPALPAWRPDSENFWVTELSRAIPAGSMVFLGNSLPVREWQMAALWRKDLQVFANRGANGIDGEISTFLGLAASAVSQSWGIFGDLTTLYDLAGPWILGQIGQKTVRLVVINNGGGAIFSKLPALAAADQTTRDLVCNKHILHFNAFAALWGLAYRRVETPEDLAGLPPEPMVLEIVPKADS